MVISRKEYLKAVETTKNKMDGYVILTEQTYNRIWKYVQLVNELHENTLLRDFLKDGDLHCLKNLSVINLALRDLIKSGVYNVLKTKKKTELRIKGALYAKLSQDGDFYVSVKIPQTRPFIKLDDLDSPYAYLYTIQRISGRIGIKNRSINRDLLELLNELNEYGRIYHITKKDEKPFVVLVWRNGYMEQTEVFGINPEEGIEIYDMRLFLELMSDEGFSRARDAFIKSNEFFSKLKTVLHDNRELLKKYYGVE